MALIKEFHIKGFINKGIEPSFALPHLIVMQDNALENMIPHIETITIYNYFVENWENAIIPTKNILNILDQDANNLYEAHKDEKTFQAILHSHSYR